MITITKNGNAVLFEFEENQHYLYNGTIEVPLNSLSLVTDESEMFTFKKAATNDIFISARYDDVNMSKSQLIDFYISNMVGSTGGGSESGITSGDVQTMIDTSLEDYYDVDEIDAALSGKADSSAVTEAINSAVSGKADSSAVTQEISAAVSGKADTSAVTESINAAVSGKVDTTTYNTYTAATDARMAEDEEVTAAALNALNDGKQDTLIAGSGITISGNVISAEGGNLVIELTEAEYNALVDKDPNAFYIITDATEINISDYYTSAQTQSAINAAVSGKQDTLIAGSGITISGNVISANGGGSITVDTALDSGSTNPVENRVIYNKFDEVEQVTAAALNALNEELSGKADSSDVTDAINSAVSGKADTSSVYTKSEVDTALSGKQDTLVSGTNIKTINNESILGSGNIDIQGGSTYTAGRGIDITNDTISFNLPISAGTGTNSIVFGNATTAQTNGTNAFGGGKSGSAHYVVSFGQNSFSYGEGTQAYKNNSQSFGNETESRNISEHSIGQFNVSNSATTTFGNSGNTLFSVGNGTSNSARHNAFEIRQNGDIYIADTNDTSTTNYYQKPMIKLQDALGGTVDTEITSASTNPVTSAAIYNQLGGLKLVKLTQAEYSAMEQAGTLDNSTLYIVTDS